MKTLIIFTIINLITVLNVCAIYNNQRSNIENYNPIHQLGGQTLEHNIANYINEFGYDKFTMLMKSFRDGSFVFEKCLSLESMLYRQYKYHTVSFIDDNNKLHIIAITPLDEIRIDRDYSVDIYHVNYGRVLYREREYKLYRRDVDGWVVVNLNHINKSFEYVIDKHIPSRIVFNYTNEVTDDNKYFIEKKINGVVVIGVVEMSREYTKPNHYIVRLFEVVYTLTPCNIHNKYRVKVNRKEYNKQ